MLVFVITSGYPNEISPYSGIFVKEQCIALSKCGCEIVVLDASSLGWRHWNTNSYFTTNVNYEDGITVYTNHYKGIALSRLPRFSMLNYYKKIHGLYKLAVEKHGIPNIIHAHFTFTSGYAASILSQKYKVPFVVTEHSSLFLRSKLHPEIRRMLITTIERSDAFICVSKFLSKAIQNHTNNKKEMKIIPNMIDDIFDFSEQPKNRKFIFFSAGNLYKVKRMDILIKAFVKAFSRTEDVILEIAGDGYGYQELKEMIIKNGREKQILLLGKLNRKEMYDKYRECSVFVLVSLHETFGIVYREAMAVGRPVISTKNGGIMDGWKESLGMLVDVDDVDSLASALKYIYSNIDNYNNADISKYVKDIYSSRVVAKKIKLIYEEVLK